MKRALIILAVIGLLSIVALPSITYAACAGGDTPQGQVQQGIGATGSTCDSGGVTSFVSTIVEILSIVAGIIAIIMFIITGLKYMTSGGDSGKVASAKNTLIYAIIGLLIAALAQVLVRFVLHEASRV